MIGQLQYVIDTLDCLVEKLLICGQKINCPSIWSGSLPDRVMHESRHDNIECPLPLFEKSRVVIPVVGFLIIIA